MTEKTERYRALSEIASMLRETTQKRQIFAHNEDGSLSYETEYYNSVFSEEEHEDVKRAFLKMCNEI